MDRTIRIGETVPVSLRAVNGILSQTLQVTWVNTDPGVGTLLNVEGGLPTSTSVYFTGVAVGVATITATALGISVSSRITVEAADTALQLVIGLPS